MMDTNEPDQVKENEEKENNVVPSAEACFQGDQPSCSKNLSPIQSKSGLEETEDDPVVEDFNDDKVDDKEDEQDADANDTANQYHYGTETGEETEGEPLTESMKRKVKRIVKRELRQIYAPPPVVDTEVDSEEEKILQKRRKRRKKQDRVQQKTYKYGRWMMIGLALCSVPLDSWKLYQGVEKTERALEAPSAIEVFDFYSTTIATHVIGLAAAWDHNLWLTVGCRLASTYMYQSDYSSKGNSSVPTDPKELQKYLKEKVPKHRLPKGYQFPKDDEELPPGVKKGRMKDRKGSKKGKKSSSPMKGDTGQAKKKVSSKSKLDKKETKKKGKKVSKKETNDYNKKATVSKKDTSKSKREKVSTKKAKKSNRKN